MNLPSETLKNQRLTLALVGKTNAGKSSLINLIAGQEVAIASPIAGTTTDVVEQSMELLPLGPVLWLDTGGWDDTTELGAARREKTNRALARADIVLAILSDDGAAPDPEALALSRRCSKPLIFVVTKTDIRPPRTDWLEALRSTGKPIVVNNGERDAFLRVLKPVLASLLPKEFTVPPEPLAGIVPRGGTVLQIIPIDSQAPKGRLILPQVNVLRNALDRDYLSVVVTEKRIREAAEKFRPDLAVCDSQVVGTMIRELPPDIPATTYSILMARLKGDLPSLAAGAAAIRHLKDGDTILIGEACTHHAADDDIGRVKIPNQIRTYTGKQLNFEIASGKDFPKDLSRFALVVHCGGCMINRAFMLWRIARAAEADVPITNYGVALSETQGVLNRVLAPFGIVP